MNATDINTAVTLDSANQRLREVFAPWIQQLNLTVEAIDGDTVTLRMPYSDSLCRSGSIVCGQALMALIDTCMVYVCYNAMGKYADCATVSQNTSFLRPVKGTDVIAKGRTVKAGRTLVFGEVTLYSDGDTKPVSMGVITYAVLP
ncbi:hypothetical protein AB833_23940 [Chromatiales bacterium (ex Bugula neritina AB1)]|nr:hypothetical protein AB833_23940 [Chromatiales bacterium (ex Bugula neritina AB1)]